MATRLLSHLLTNVLDVPRDARDYAPMRLRSNKASAAARPSGDPVNGARPKDSRGENRTAA